MPVTVRRRAKAQPVKTVRKLSKVGQVITQESGCSRSRNDGTRDTGASLLNALVLQPRIVREAPLVPERLFLGRKSAKVELSVAQDGSTRTFGSSASTSSSDRCPAKSVSALAAPQAAP